MVKQTERDFLEILGRINALDNSMEIFDKKMTELVNLMSIQITAIKTDTDAIKRAIERIEIRYMGKL